MNKETARKLRKAIEKGLKTLSVAEMLEVPELFQKWKQEKSYNNKDIVNRDGVLYEVNNKGNLKKL